MRSRLLRWALRAGLALLLGLIFVTSAYVSFNYWVRRGVTAIPDAKGLDEDEARAMLGAAGLVARRADVPRFSAEVEAGRVLESRPAAGSLVKRGAEVELVLSRGEERIRVPDLGGKALAAARLTLEGEGLAIGAALAIYTNRGPAGTVVGQEPAPGAELGVGERVQLLVAREELRPAWVMPDLVARRYEPVRARLQSDGFRFGGVTFEPYEGVASGTILRQSPEPGHRLGRNDSISLVVAGDTAGGLR